MGIKLRKVFDLKRENKQKMFIVLVFFLVSFFLVHFYSLHFSRYVYVKGYHIHHFYFGTAALFFGGILGILSVTERRLKIASAFIGIGTGLFADEIGMLLNCTSASKQCAYIFPDTPDIIMIITVIIIFLIALADSDLIALKNRLLNKKGGVVGK
jgi:hypothetical protein